MKSGIVVAALMAFTGLDVVLAAPPARSRAPSPRWVERAASLDQRRAAAIDSNRVAEAVILADSAVSLRRQRSGARPLAIASYLDTLGRGFFAAGSSEGWQAAERFFEQSLAIRERESGPDDLDVARTLFALATLDDYLGQWDRAAGRAQRALDIRRLRRGEQDALVASSARQLGMLRFALGQYAEAESLVTRSLAIYESLEGDYAPRIVDNLNNLGEIHRVQDHGERAEATFRRGLEIAGERVPDDAGLRVVLMNNLAGVYKDQARYADAEPLLIESLRLREAEAYPDQEAIATGHLNLAEVYRLQGRAEEAEPEYTRALAMARTVFGAEHPDLAPFIGQSAVFYEELEDHARAVPLFREALETTERALGPDHPLVAQALDDYGRLLTAEGDLVAAATHLRRALGVRERRLGAGHPDAAVVRVHLARCLSRDVTRGPGAGVAELERAIAVLDSTRVHPETRLDAYALRAELREGTGDRRGAAADLGLALALVDTLRVDRGGGELSRAALLARHLDLYHRVVRLRLAAGDPDGALEAHERGRARILLDQLGSAGLDFHAGLPAGELEPLARGETAARDRLSRAQRSIESLRAREDLARHTRLELLAALEAARDSAVWDVQRARDALRERSPIWRTMLTSNGRPASRGEIAAVLNRGEMLLEYHVGPDASTAFLLERDGKTRAAALVLDAEAAERLGVTPGPLDAARLERIVAGDREAGARGRAGVAQLLSRTASARIGLTPARARDVLDQRLAALWRVLVPAPLASRLRVASQVVIVPDGALHLLPFEALVTGDDGGSSRYWLDWGPAIRYCASATSLVELERRARSRAAAAPLAALSVSDPAFGRGADVAPDSAQRGGERWTPLPGTRRETEAVRAAFAPAPVDTLVGAAATEPAVRAALPTHGLLHLATHGFVTERRSDLLAGLVLAAPAADSGGTDDDGLLQLYEIYGLRLDADLAVLSACETARGARVDGEGVFALSRGFLTAGARRVVASLWSVNDLSTAVLMSELFGRLAGAQRNRRGIDYASLLRDAKRTLRARPETDAPYFWAPFVVSGVR